MKREALECLQGCDTNYRRQYDLRIQHECLNYVATAASRTESLGLVFQRRHPQIPDQMQGRCRFLSLSVGRILEMRGEPHRSQGTFSRQFVGYLY